MTERKDLRESEDFAVWLNSYNRVHHADITPPFAPDYLVNEFLADKKNGVARVEDRQRNEIERLHAEMGEAQRNLRDAYGMTTALNREIEMLNRVRVTQAARVDELARLLTEGRDLVNDLTAENAKLRAELAELKRIIKYIDKKFPRADETCDEPGITLSEAVRRTLAEQSK